MDVLFLAGICVELEDAPCSKVKHNKLYPVPVKRQSAETATTEKLAVYRKVILFLCVYHLLYFLQYCAPNIFACGDTLVWLKTGILSADYCKCYWFECICYDKFLL